MENGSVQEKVASSPICAGKRRKAKLGSITVKCSCNIDEDFIEVDGNGDYDNIKVRCKVNSWLPTQPYGLENLPLISYHDEFTLSTPLSQWQFETSPADVEAGVGALLAKIESRTQRTRESTPPYNVYCPELAVRNIRSGAARI